MALFLVALFLLWPQMFRPGDWLLAHGWIGGLDERTAALNLSAFAAAIIPTIIAAWLERRSIADYGIPWKRAFGGRFWEGAAWGVGITTLQAALLQASHSISFHSASLHINTAFAACGRWAVAALSIGLLEECLKRGYLQFVVGRSTGFWPAAILLSSLWGLEKLPTMPEYRSVIPFVGMVLYGLLVCLTLKLTGSLWFAIGLHSALEWTAVFVFGMSTPIIPNPQGTLLRPVLQGPGWITGGPSGLAASVLTPLGFAFVWIALRRRFRPTENASS